LSELFGAKHDPFDDVFKQVEEDGVLGEEVDHTVSVSFVLS
jgi:hypothetical protein